MSIELVMPSNHLIFCHTLLLLPSVFPSIRVFSNDLVPCIWLPNHWNISFSISSSNEYSGLISFRINWFDLLAVQGTLKSLLQRHSSKVSVLQWSAFFMVQLSHPYLITEKTIASSVKWYLCFITLCWFLCTTTGSAIVCCSIAQSCPTLCNSMHCSTPGLPVPHHLPKFAQVHVHCIGDTIQPSQPLTPSSPLPSIFPSIRDFSNESAVPVRWPKYWSFSPSISPSN